MNKILLKKHLVEGPIKSDFSLHLRVRDYTTWFWRCVGTAFGLSQFHGHCSWLVCEVAHSYIFIGCGPLEKSHKLLASNHEQHYPLIPCEIPCRFSLHRWELTSPCLTLATHPFSILSFWMIGGRRCRVFVSNLQIPKIGSCNSQY